MPKSRTRHSRKSFQKGDLVEYIGRGGSTRGIGIVLEEVSFDMEDMDEREFSYLKVFWQHLHKEEIIHKALVRRIAEVTKRPKKK